MISPLVSHGADVSTLVSAAHALARHGLVTAFGHVSMRAADSMLITPPIALGDATENTLVAVPLDAEVLPAGTPPEAWAHLAIYRDRADVSAVARAMPPSAFAASATTTAVPVLHGQTAWLGDLVPVHPSSTLLRSDELASRMTESMRGQDSVILRGNGALTTGADPGVAVARMFLLEIACRVWLDAAAVGSPAPLPPDEVLGWQAAAPQLLPRLWQQLSTT